MNELKKRNTEINEQSEEQEAPKESTVQRKFSQVFVSDGVYKNVYDDTGEDVV